MGNIGLLIIFFIFRAVIGRLFESQKAQTSQTTQAPKTLGRVKKHSLPPIQDFRPKTTTIKESKAIEIKPGITSIPVEEKYLQKTITQTHVKPEHLPQPESDSEIPELFTQENILRGIILQEVLSPPKAIAHRRH